jgi:hypothetical protein
MKSLPQVHRSFTPGQPCKRRSSTAVRTPHVGAVGHSGPSRPRNGKPICHCRQVPAARPDGPHDASRDRGCPPGSARATVPHASAGQTARPPAQRRHPPHECPGPEAPSDVTSAISARPSRPPSSRGPARTTGRPHMEGTPGSAAPLKPGHAASAARPWPSVESPTVSPDRRNCAHRPS